MRFVSIVTLAFLSVALAGCFERDEASTRFKITVSAVVDGESVHSTSVMEITWSHSSLNLLGSGGISSAKGEAVVLDLGKRGKVFVLPWKNNPDGSFGQYYEIALPQTVGITSRITKFGKNDFARLRALEPGQKFTPDFYDKMAKKHFQPFMVMLGDPTDPATVVEVTKDNFADLFGANSSFEGITIEITDQPHTTGTVFAHLPLLKDRKRIWSQRPRNLARLQLPPMSQRPLNWRMGPSLFFAFGNY
ncbi:MAG: hypothetical protein GY927_18625 [bacterium]|nr:hypothetical protein [bacterium]